MTESEIWSSMLKSASNVSNTKTGMLVVLGGTADDQKNIITRLQQRPAQEPRSARSSNRPSSSGLGRSNTGMLDSALFFDAANSFGLGYGAVDFMDEQAEVLSHIDAYTMEEYYADNYVSALKSALDRRKKKESLLVMLLLDWKQIRQWATKLTFWLDIISRALGNIDETIVKSIQHIIQTYHSSMFRDVNITNTVELPLEEGQYSVPIGVDLVIATTDSDIIESLSDPAIDFAIQFLRTISFIREY